MVVPEKFYEYMSTVSGPSQSTGIGRCICYAYTQRGKVVNNLVAHLQYPGLPVGNSLYRYIDIKLLMCVFIGQLLPRMNWRTGSLGQGARPTDAGPSLNVSGTEDSSHTPLSLSKYHRISVFNDIWMLYLGIFVRYNFCFLVF